MFRFLLGVAGRRSDFPLAHVFPCCVPSGPYHHLSIDAMLSFGSTDLLAVCATPPLGTGFLALQISKPSPIFGEQDERLFHPLRADCQR